MGNLKPQEQKGECSQAETISTMFHGASKYSKYSFVYGNTKKITHSPAWLWVTGTRNTCSFQTQ